jgi:hypothetical protein
MLGAKKANTLATLNSKNSKKPDNFKREVKSNNFARNYH